MDFSRRHCLGLMAGAVALPAMSRNSWAVSYPTRPVRWVVGATPGSSPDIVARLLGQWLSERLGSPVVVENRPGAGTNIATEVVVNAAADGHTLLLVGAAQAVNATLYEKLNYNFTRDIAPVGSICREPNVMVVNPSVPAESVPEFIAYARAHPGKLNMASAGNGTIGHMAGELFKMMTGIDMVHVPYRSGAPAITDLLGGQVEVIFIGAAASMEHIKTGKLRALAVTTAERSEALPELPPVADFLPGYEASSLAAVGVPKQTPIEIVDQLNKEINAALVDPKIIARLAALGNTVLAGSSADLGNLIAEETRKWAKVVRSANLKPD